MTDVTLIAILLVFFALAIGLVRVLGRMIEGDGDPEEFPDELPDADGPSAAGGRTMPAGSLAGARTHARTRATLDASGLTFAAFLVGVIVIVGGLIYFPMLILGPIGERIVG